MGAAVKVLGVVIVLILTALVTIAVFSFQKLNSDEVGLKYDMISKNISGLPSFEGLHSGPPGFKFIIFPSVFKSLEFEDIRCLNKDGVEIRLDISFQYKIRSDKLHELVYQFRRYDEYKLVIQYVAESAIHDACSAYTTPDFQAERGSFQEKVRDKLAGKFDPLMTDVKNLQVNDITRPHLYQISVEKKESAREEIQVAMEERPQKLTAAETEILETQTQAQMALDKATSEARSMLAKASADAEGILDQYTRESAAYKGLLSSSGLNLDVDGLLSYMSVRMIEDAKNPVQVNVNSPARTGWLGE